MALNLSLLARHSNVFEIKIKQKEKNKKRVKKAL
jgi:hypothetical protein